MTETQANAERQRLEDQRQGREDWRLWGPYLAERAFGLTGSQGNRGEDVKEVYFYRDTTPSHNWLRFLYKYPQRAFPYDDLINESARRGRGRGEAPYHLIDTGVFDAHRYWDVEILYAKASPTAVYCRIYVKDALHRRVVAGEQDAVNRAHRGIKFAAWSRFELRPHRTAQVDVDFAKDQVELMVSDRYLHPNGQITAYEWNFGHVNPPAHAMAAIKVFRAERIQRGEVYSWVGLIPLFAVDREKAHVGACTALHPTAGRAPGRAIPRQHCLRLPGLGERARRAAAGIGGPQNAAAHQTGWSGLLANLVMRRYQKDIQPWSGIDVGEKPALIDEIA